MASNIYSKILKFHLNPTSQAASKYQKQQLSLQRRIYFPFGVIYVSILFQHKLYKNHIGVKGFTRLEVITILDIQNDNNSNIV